MPQRTLPGMSLTGFWDLGDPYKTENDDNLRKLSALVNLQALSRSATPPGSPAPGAIYLVPDTDPTNPNQVAVWDGPAGSEAYVYLTPRVGLSAFVLDEGVRYFFNGVAWQVEKSYRQARLFTGPGTYFTGPPSAGGHLFVQTSGGDCTVQIRPDSVFNFTTGTYMYFLKPDAPNNARVEFVSPASVNGVVGGTVLLSAGQGSEIHVKKSYIGDTWFASGDIASIT